MSPDEAVAGNVRFINAPLAGSPVRGNGMMHGEWRAREGREKEKEG